jgi:hypothetical protein
LQKSTDSASNPQVTMDIYKIEITDIDKRGYLLLKHEKTKQFQILEGVNYLIDRAKLVINKKGEVIIVSTASTVLLSSYFLIGV